MGQAEVVDSVVETDRQSRLVLSGHSSQRYLKTESPDGVIVLEPAVVVSELEWRFVRNEALQRTIAEAKAHPERRVKRTRRPSDALPE